MTENIPSHSFVTSRSPIDLDLAIILAEYKLDDTNGDPKMFISLFERETIIQKRNFKNEWTRLSFDNSFIDFMVSKEFKIKNQQSNIVDITSAFKNKIIESESEAMETVSELNKIIIFHEKVPLGYQAQFFLAENEPKITNTIKTVKKTKRGTFYFAGQGINFSTFEMNTILDFLKENKSLIGNDNNKENIAPTLEIETQAF